MSLLDHDTFTRRDVITGMLAATAIAVPTSALADTPDNFDELLMLLDQREEVVALHNLAIRDFDAIDMLADRPPMNPTLALGRVFSEEHVDKYYRSCAGKIFDNAETIHTFFKDQLTLAGNRARCREEWAEWPAVKTADYAATVSAYEQKVAERECWETATGYRDAEDKMMGLLDELTTIEDRIYDLPCLSFRDLRVKLGLIDRWLMDDRHMSKIILSIRPFANSG